MPSHARARHAQRAAGRGSSLVAGRAWFTRSCRVGVRRADPAVRVLSTEWIKSSLVPRKLRFLVFFVGGLHALVVGVEPGTSGLYRELPVDLDVLGTALGEQGQD